MRPFWYDWSSWPTELLSGLLCAWLGAWVAFALQFLVLHQMGTIAFLSIAGANATVLSLVYERWFDRNGWELEDVQQRQVGILCGLLLLLPALLR